MHQVFLHRIGHVQAEDFLAGGENGVLADPALGLGFAIEGFAPCLLQDSSFDGGIRKTDFDVHQEAVELGFGQRVGTFLLDGVLRGHHQKQGR
ncbi:hypothetical protein D3C84_480680 [compost metagenome]